MEITNCEQYVLAELDYEQRRNERLAAENNKLFKQLDAMTKRANGYSRIINRPKTPIEALADKVMREEMLTRFTYAEVTDLPLQRVRQRRPPEGLDALPRVEGPRAAPELVARPKPIREGVTRWQPNTFWTRRG